MTPANVLWYAAGATASSATSYESGSKKGKACATSYLGLIASGDATIRAAAEDGRINNVHSVSHETFGIMGFYADVCTIVRGTE
ncbi:MAG: TRL-like family protein [Leptospirales bacterium]